jgi:hypothetical protein
MAEAERVLREISVVATCTHLDLSLARAMPDPLPLDQGLDFIVHDDGMIELTEAGFRRMRQAYSAGLDTVIKIDGRDVIRFPVMPVTLDPVRPSALSLAARPEAAWWRAERLSAQAVGSRRADCHD